MNSLKTNIFYLMIWKVEKVMFFIKLENGRTGTFIPFGSGSSLFFSNSFPRKSLIQITC